GRGTGGGGAMLRRASFGAADCPFSLGDYDDAVRRYRQLEQRYAKQVGQLFALATLWRCHYHLAQPLSPQPKRDHLEKADQALDDLATALEGMPESAFDGSGEEFRRRFWERWYARVGLKLADDLVVRGEYDEAGRRFEAVARLYVGQVEELLALQRVWRLQSQYRKAPEKAQEALRRLSAALAKIKDDQFDGPTEEYKRAFWVKWLT